MSREEILRNDLARLVESLPEDSVREILDFSEFIVRKRRKTKPGRFDFSALPRRRYGEISGSLGREEIYGDE